MGSANTLGGDLDSASWVETPPKRANTLIYTNLWGSIPTCYYFFANSHWWTLIMLFYLLKNLMISCELSPFRMKSSFPSWKEGQHRVISPLIFSRRGCQGNLISPSPLHMIHPFKRNLLSIQGLTREGSANTLGGDLDNTSWVEAPPKRAKFTWLLFTHTLSQ